MSGGKCPGREGGFVQFFQFPISPHLLPLQIDLPTYYLCTDVASMKYNV